MVENRIYLKSGASFLADLEACGPLISTTKNQSARQKSRGIYMNTAFHGPTGIVRGPGIDLRLWPDHWVHVEACPPSSPEAPWSLEIRDSHQALIHQIQTTPQTNLPEFERVLKQYSSKAPNAPEPKPAHETPAPKAPGQEETKALLYRWSNLRNTHEFAPMLREMGLHRLSAIQAVIGDFARKVEKRSARLLFQEVQKIQLPIMVFSGNPGCLQIFTGKIKDWSLSGKTLNLSAGEHEIEMDESSIAFSYVVRKPTTEGIVSSLELFDSRGDLMVQIFSARNPQKRESDEWRSILIQLPDDPFEEFLCD